MPDTHTRPPISPQPSPAAARSDPGLADPRDRAVAALLAERRPEGRWRGRLTSSALSTATACCALAALARQRPPADAEETDQREETEQADELDELVAGAIRWLAQHQNADGGWGDTTDSPSNPSTTVLAWAALGFTAAKRDTTVERAEVWLRRHLGDLSPERLAPERLSPERLCASITAAYGDDRTFSVPILTLCALTGRLGEGEDAWRKIPAIPFELGVVPSRWLHLLGLPMVSYALPALIAIGQAIHHHRPSRNPAARLARTLSRRRTLGVLERIQPDGGGFLEAAPLTSFVLLSLVGIGRHDHPVSRRAAEFLVRTVRDDGSWPIDTDLSTWLTTLSVNALAKSGALETSLNEGERIDLRSWLIDQQHTRVHPYTGAAPGGWAWTDLSGGVPDADDTPGALLALGHLDSGLDRHGGRRLDRAVTLGVGWLLDLQNRDGGIPTFCRGWGRLPFDRSSPDLTAHSLRAWHRWHDRLPVPLRRRVERATAAAVRFLLRSQRSDGTWLPLWFGNQHEERMENPVYGTSRVLCAPPTPPGLENHPELLGRWHDARRRAHRWLLEAQGDDGGWGGGPQVPASVEETALALEGLAASASGPDDRARDALDRGRAWLDEATAGGTSFPASPIGLYFEKLWYAERLYPLIFTVAAGSSVEPTAP